jgi:hypothetical protein
MRKVKVHFEITYEDPIKDRPLTPCGIIGKDSTKVTNSWGHTTCKRCLKQKKKIDEMYKESEQTAEQLLENIDRAVDWVMNNGVL